MDIRWSQLREWARDHPTVLDTALVAVLEVWVLGSLHGSADHDWWRLLLAQLLVLPLILRRRYPWPVFWLLATVGAIQWLVAVRFAADAALLISLYTVAAHQSRRRALVAAGILEIGVVLASVRFAPTGDGVLASTIFLTGMVAAALFSGITLQTRRQYLGALVERAARLEYERDQQRRLAATEERTRIARELHDVIAHSLSVIITLADAAALANNSQPAQATEAMEQVAATGRASMAEMRRLLGVLREHDTVTTPNLAPQPDLGHIDSLVAEVRAAGLPARLSVTGIPQQLPPSTQSAAYRIIQEGLTNALKHAREPNQVRVELRWRTEALHIDVIDDGKPLDALHHPNRATTMPPSDTRGHGLIGMRERAGLFAGTVSAGPTSGGGWRVHAVLPVQPA